MSEKRDKNFTEFLNEKTKDETNNKMLICRECGKLVPETEISAKGICAKCIGLKVLNSRKRSGKNG